MEQEHEIPAEFSSLRYWEQGLNTARVWYHEEWDGSWIQLCLARDIAREIEIEVRKAVAAPATEIWQAASDRIEDYDRREAAGEDVSNELRPRMPGGSDW